MQPLEDAVVGGLAAAVVVLVVLFVLFAVVTVLIISFRRKRSTRAVDFQSGLGESVVSLFVLAC